MARFGESTTATTTTSGTSGATSSATGMANVLPELQYNATAPTLTDTQFVNAQADASGAQKVNPGVTNAAPVQTAVSVTTADGAAIAANASRTFLSIQNQDGTNPIWVSFGGTAVASGVCLKILAGGYWEAPVHMVPNTAVRAISTGGTVVSNFMEAS